MDNIVDGYSPVLWNGVVAIKIVLQARKDFCASCVKITDDIKLIMIGDMYLYNIFAYSSRINIQSSLGILLMIKRIKL